MPRPASLQTRFLIRASLLFSAFLVVWWFALLPPLLGWTRISTDILLNAFPGAPLNTGVLVLPGDIWVLQAPIRINGQTRNVRVETAQRLPAQLTMGIPLFWAIVLAGRGSRRIGRTLVIGSAVLLLLPPLGLLIYAARIVQIYVYPNASALLVRSIAGADYVASTVAPYVGPVLLALALDTELRAAILYGGSPDPAGKLDISV
jgi:hypothetical protein